MNPSLFVTLEQCLKGNNALASPNTSFITAGSLVRFTYLYAKPGHDQTPLVLLTAPIPYKVNYLRGINLNYLTFPTIKGLLQSFAENTSFSYRQNLKGSEYIVSAFRQYKRPGVSGIQKLNSAFLLNTLACARSVDPNEIEAIRRVVREQIRRVVNEQAGPSSETVVGQNPTRI